MDPAYPICLVAVCFGAMAQRLSGQAFGMIAAPVLALMAPEHLPASLLLLGLGVGLTSSVVDLSAIDRAALPPGFSGRALGGVLAAMVAPALIAADWLGPTIALVVLAAVGLSLAGVRVAITRASLFIAGLCAGLMGTLTAVGAPPMAMLYQHAPAKRSRAMQNVFFLWGMAWSIGALTLMGLVGWGDVVFALWLIPGVAVGLVAAQGLTAWTERRAIRPVALSFAGLSALILLGRSLW